MPRRIIVVVILLICAQITRATVITNTRPQIAQMAGYWEVDSVQISALVNSVYPQFGSNWEYSQPSGSTASDGDEHINMVLDSSGTGANGNNTGTESPLVAEIINAAGHLLSAANQHSESHGIFRYYHEHAGEVKYEIHPVTEMLTWNGSAFVVSGDFRTNTIQSVSDGTTKALSTYTDIVQGNNQSVTVHVLADNNRVELTFPTSAGADTVNYLQYDGRVMTPLTNDFCSPYITFLATNCPKGAISGARVMRCRIITNTAAAYLAAGLVSNQTLTVNVLNRVDMLGISNQVASMTANQSTSIVQPLEWITMGLTNPGPVSPPVAAFSGSPTNGTAPLIVTFTDTSSGSITNRFWDFGDSSSTNLTTNSVVHTYAAGTYTVKLIVSGLGASATNNKPNYVVASSGSPTPPVASFTGSPTNGTAPLSVTFSDTSTGSITNRFWDFGDSNTTNVTTNSVAHPYAAGTYNVTLVVAGPAGVSTNMQANYITVTLPPPVASFSGSPTNGTEPLTVTFTDTSTGTITNRFWTFGDTSTTNVTTNSVAHTYAAGSYTVSLIVSGPGGSGTNTQANYINVLTAFQAWQVQYFGSTNNPNAAPDADPDGDGFSNLQEYLAGIDPTNNASTFAITSIVQQGNDFLITWTMGSGKTNALQLSLGDGNGNYSNNFTDLFTVTNTVGSVTNYLDAGAVTNPPPRFYRIRLVP